ncbi:hypothetical protein LJR255_004758 [Pararhizobium sp. LjRoot255]|uniref:hypothetical protein n=1 Tax=Pararhizobium sp. LjRoot255 TaxID=3342298 RepID=UPI003ED141B7
MEILFKALGDRLDKVEQRNDNLLEKFHAQITAFEAHQAGTPTDISDVDQLQFEYAVAKRRLDEVAATHALNSAARTRLEALTATQPAERCGGLLSAADWQRLSDELAAIEFADVEDLHVGFAVSRVLGQSYSEQRYELEQATSLEDLRRKVLAIAYKILLISKKLDVAASNRVHLLNSRNDMMAQALAFQSAHLEYSERTLDEAQRYTAAAQTARKELHALVERLSKPNTSLESSVNEARALVAGIVVMDFKIDEISKGIPAKLDYKVRMRSLIDMDGSFDSWSTDLEIRRNFYARFLYCIRSRSLNRCVPILKRSGLQQRLIATTVWEGCPDGSGFPWNTSMRQCITAPAIGRDFSRRTHCSRPPTSQIRPLTGTMPFSCSYSRMPFLPGTGANR